MVDIKLIRSQKIEEWFTETVNGITQKQLIQFVDAGVPLAVFCIESEEKPLHFEIVVDLKETVGDKPRRMLVINRREGRRFYRAETACKLLLNDLGFKSVEFYSLERRAQEGLDFKTEKVSGGNSEGDTS